MDFVCTRKNNPPVLFKVIVLLLIFFLTAFGVINESIYFLVYIQYLNTKKWPIFYDYYQLSAIYQSLNMVLLDTFNKGILFSVSMVSYFRIIRNPIFILTSANQVFTILSVGGWSGFVAKFMMIHFNIPLHMANYILGK